MVNLDLVHSLAFVERHGYALLFFWVLAEQGAVPLPSVPLLLGAGALIHAGRMALAPAILCCLAGALVADAVWFVLGRLRGRQVLRLVCRLSLEPDSCVRTTEKTYRKYGLRSLLVSKFVPGLNALAAPLAGHSGVSYSRFALYDLGGATLWCGGYIALGYLFSGELDRIAEYASGMGSRFGVFIAACFAIWISWKYRQRSRTLRQLRGARISPEELQRRMAAGEDFFIVDLRNGSDEEPLIPGAVRIAPEELAGRRDEIPADREIILFCS